MLQKRGNTEPRPVTVEQLFAACPELTEIRQPRWFEWDDCVRSDLGDYDDHRYPNLTPTVLDIPSARAALCDAGIVVTDLDQVADLMACGLHPKPQEADYQVPLLTGGFALCAGLMIPVCIATGNYSVCALLAVFVIVSLIWFVLSMTSARSQAKQFQTRTVWRTRDILERHSRRVTMPADMQQLMHRAVDAQNMIKSAPVWRDSLFDAHRVRIDLNEELDQIHNRLRRLTSATAGATGDRAAMKVRREVLRSTKARVKALEDYQKQVAEADRQYAKLRAAETAEANTSRLTDLLASTGADQSAIDNLTQLTAESRAAAEGIRSVLELMSQTVASLGTTAR